MDNIEDLLRALTDEDDENEENTSDSTENTSSQNSSDGFFSGFDPEMMIKLFGLFETLNQPDDNERFLLALKPLLREENRAKIDSAMRLMKLFSLIPILKQSGILDDLGKML